MQLTLGPQDTQKASSRAGDLGKSSYLAVSTGDSLQLVSIMWSSLSYFCFPSDFVFQTESHYAIQADLELSQAPKPGITDVYNHAQRPLVFQNFSAGILRTQTKGLS